MSGLRGVRNPPWAQGVGRSNRPAPTIRRAGARLVATGGPASDLQHAILLEKPQTLDQPWHRLTP
jgi:hypothetical protein